MIKDDWSLKNDNEYMSLAGTPIMEKLRKKLIEDIRNFDRLEQILDDYKADYVSSSDWNNFEEDFYKELERIINRRFGYDKAI